MNLVITNGGIKSPDRANCTIRALALTASIPYETADKIGKEAGRKKNCGFNPYKLLRKAKGYGIKTNKLKYRSITIQKFLAKHPTGRYYATTNCHAFAVINGSIHDNVIAKPLQRITNVWRIESNRLNMLRETQSF